jgi:dethiobiotin synthetase
VNRPARLVGIAGTGTEVGKTWFATRFLAMARSRGAAVAARKPAQSFDSIDGAATDAEALGRASGESPATVCPRHRWYPLAMSPPMAADQLRRPQIRLDELVAEIAWPPAIELGLIETAGGVHSPIAHDADNVDLLKRVAPDDVVLVADAGLGVINAVRLSLSALRDFNVSVFLNRFDERNELHRLNRLWLRERYGIDAMIIVDELHAPLRAPS